MKKRKITAVLAMMLAFMMLVSACGGGDIDQQLAEIAKNNQKVESNDKEADKADKGDKGGLFGGLFGVQKLGCIRGYVARRELCDKLCAFRRGYIGTSQAFFAR